MQSIFSSKAGVNYSKVPSQGQGFTFIICTMAGFNFDTCTMARSIIEYVAFHVIVPRSLISASSKGFFIIELFVEPRRGTHAHVPDKVVRAKTVVLQRGAKAS